MMNPADISIHDFRYELPNERIALHPLQQRDASKLLVYRDGEIAESVFAKIADFLPETTFLVFNNTWVINARLRFKKSSGAHIEIFCLDPLGAITEYSTVMNATSEVHWKCLVGGAAKWKNEILEKQLFIDGVKVLLKAEMIEKFPEAYHIRLSWTPAEIPFAAVIEAAGDVPLPPYIKRNTDEGDHERYQTIFAEKNGSVAAPTAGLHFTSTIFSSLAEKKISTGFVTLHVGAGTFKPVKAEKMGGHIMHAEYIDVSPEFIRKLKENTGRVAAVGTTSLRTIESLYWLGVKAFLDPGVSKLSLGQWEVYDQEIVKANVEASVALQALLTWMEQHEQRHIFTQTQLMIAPGYKFRAANMLITNFHQPQSTLLLLVAAAVGEDWKKTYQYAMDNGFRFLSYGDGNLIFLPAENIAPPA